MLSFLSVASMRDISAASTLIVLLPMETCTAGDSPKKFGSVYRKAARIANAISAYFQVGKRFTLLEGLDRSLGQRHLHRAALHHDLRVRRDLQGEVLLAKLGDAPDHAARGDHFVALLQRLDHGLLLLGALHLRTDHQEVEQHEHQDDGQEAHQPGVAAEALCVGGRDDHGWSSSESFSECSGESARL